MRHGILIIAMIYGLPLWSQTSVAHICELIHLRTYYIQRLSKPVNLLKKVPYSFFHITDHDFTVFQNKHIKIACNAIITEQSLFPFFHLWNNFASYKSIDDVTLMRELGKFIFLLYEKLFNKDKVRKMYADFRRIEELFLNQDTHTSQNQQLTVTEIATLHYFCIKRLAKPINYLKRVSCKSTNYLLNTNIVMCPCSFVSHHTFEHRAIISCIQRIEQSRSLHPLVSLSKSYFNYKYALDAQFLHELVLVIFSVYSNFITDKSLQYKIPLKKSIADTIYHLSSKIDSIPIEEILEAIDMLTEELPQLLDQCKLTEKIQWKTWLKKYWWLPPTAATIFGFRVAWYFNKKSLRKLPNNPLFTILKWLGQQS